MKKSVIKAGFLVLSLIAMLFLASCKGGVTAGEKPMDTAAALKAVQSGSQGVEISLMSNLPPSTVYDNNELVAILEVKNKGNHDLDLQDCFVQVTGFDKNIIRGGFDYVHSCAENQGVLEGKNVYNLNGGTNMIEFRSTDVRLPEGIFEYNPLLNFLTCYNYQTKSNPSICVDPLLFQVTNEQKTCIPHSVSMGSGQGAPVGVSYVGVEMIGGKAVFEINVVNFGTGRVLSSYADIRDCGEATLGYSDLDRVEYKVEMSNGIPLNCKPLDGFVRLVNNNGKIICSATIPGASAYETPLMVELDYNYIQSLTRSIKIVKTPGFD